jgi:ABC-type glycerol-3-phosphate transport system permease component
MFVVASRTSDAMGQLPPPITPGNNLGANISRLFDNTDAYFLTGLINSVIVASTVTVSVVFFVQLSLRALSDGYYQDMSQVFTGTAIATLPLLLVFVLFGRQIIGGIMEGAVKA